jgi:hypothetical protein
MELSFVEAMPHCEELVRNMRRPDVVELEATLGMQWTVKDIQESCRTSDNGAIAVLDAGGAVICIFGVVNAGNGVGVPWLLGTHLLDKHPRALLELTKSFLDSWMQRYCTLTNATDKRNKKILRWLRWAGFHLVREIPQYGAAKVPFIQFTLHKP